MLQTGPEVPKMKNALTETFTLGCNYWASHAGCFMWSDWRPEVIESDFALLAQNGIRCLRVFPLWPDFQPIEIHYGEFGRVHEIRFKGRPLGHDLVGAAGIDPEMLKRFGVLCRLAEKYRLGLTVMLLTGWMSGRQFKPAPLHERNIYAEPFALCWQEKYLHAMVTSLRSERAILAWGLGNESNIMSPCESRDAACVWTALMTATIRQADPSRPVITGMHGLTAGSPDTPWHIQDQGTYCDIVTTHPYAQFVPCCNQDSLLSLRPLLHPAAESTLYADLARRPCLIEEIGDLGRTHLSEADAEHYFHSILWSAWMHNHNGCFWWCAFDMDKLDRTPYDWYIFEQDLGLFRSDRKPKPVLNAMKRFSQMLASLPPECRTPAPCKREAVCILTPDQDNWAVAYAAFVLAKLAGFDLRFITTTDPLPTADLFMLPSLRGLKPLSRRLLNDLLGRVRDGADLYLSILDAHLPDLRGFAGIEIMDRKKTIAPPELKFSGNGSALPLPGGWFDAMNREGQSGSTPGLFQLRLESRGADILAADADGNPMFTRFALDRGRVFFFNFGLEAALSLQPGCFDDSAPDYHRVYQTIARQIIRQRLMPKPPHKSLILTEHEIAPRRTLWLAYNISPRPLDLQTEAPENLKTLTALYGRAALHDRRLDISLPPWSGCVLDCQSAQNAPGSEN